MTTIIDLSLQLDPNYRMHTPQGVKNVQLEFELIKDYPGGMGQMVTAVHMRLHNGTHVDAPKHFVPGGAPIGSVPLHTFVGETVVLDFTYVRENEAITAADLEKVVGSRRIDGMRVLLRSDWNHHYGETDYKERSPYIGTDAVNWLAARKPVLIGYDYAHGKDAPDAPCEAHSLRTFLEANICTMGYLRNLDQIDLNKPVTLVALPLAFTDVEASPVRAIAIQD